MSAMAELEKIPPVWIGVAVVGVALLALSQNKGSSENGGYGLIRAYEPTPMDPGIVSIQLAEIDARKSAFESVAALEGAQDISRVDASRDISLATISASRDAYLGDIAGNVAQGQTAAAREIGIAQIERGYQLGMEQVRTAGSLGLAGIASGERIAFGGFGVENRKTDAYTTTEAQRIQAQRDADAAAAATNQYSAVTARKQQKNDFWRGLAGDIMNGVAKILPFL